MGLPNLLRLGKLLKVKGRLPSILEVLPECSGVFGGVNDQQLTAGTGDGDILGSIGSVIEYIDFEPMFEKMGAKIVRVVAEQSPNKRLDPHGPEGLAELQALVDAAGAEFVAGVAANRGVTEAEVLAQFGQGLVFDGMDAIARGMADERTTLDEMVAELAGRDQIVIAAPAAAAQETPMDWANIDLAALQQHRPDLISAIETAAAATAAASERNRILGLDEVAVEGFERPPRLTARPRPPNWPCRS